MPKRFPVLRMKPNPQGVIVGTCGVLTRSGAHTYLAPSGTRPGVTHRIFVARLTPRARYRCSCEAFLFFGKCKHGRVALHVERAVARSFPTAWAHETAPTSPPTIQPYCGAPQQEEDT